MLLAILLVSLLTVSVVSAADNATSDVVSVEKTSTDVLSVEKNQVIEQTDNDDAIAEGSSGTFVDIQKMVDNSTWGGTIELSGNYVGSGETINLSSNMLTVHGNGATLDARNLSSIFYVPENGAKLYDINFINAYNSGDGGAIFHQTDWRCGLTMVNCTFTNCVSEGTGGAANIANADDCTFINCHANEYAAIGRDQYGENHAVNCMFIDCSSNGNYYAYGMENCKVISNSSLYNENRDFKAVQKLIDEANEGDTIVIPDKYYFGCSFKSIKIDKNLIIDGNGSTLDAQKLSKIFTITADNVTLKNLNFCNGYMDYYTYTSGNSIESLFGGGVYFENMGTVINCSFINCEVSREGGAIYFLNNRGIVENCTFIDCRASEGGAIYSRNSRSQASNCVFINCHASDRGGGVHNTNCDHCNFTSCSAPNYAAVSYASANYCIAENCTGNVYSSSYNSIYTIYILQKYDYAHSFEYIQELIDNADEKSTVTLPAGHYYGYSSTIKIEKPLKLRSDGGVTLDGQGLVGILMIDSPDVVLENLNFIHGKSSYGAAIYITNAGSSDYFGSSYYKDNHINILDCTFDGFYSTSYGGAIYTYADGLEITRCSFNDCNASKDGGTIYNSGENLRISNCHFSNSKSGGYNGGGTIFNCNDGVKLTYCTFTNSTAPKGGASYSTSEDTPIFEHCTFTNCTAKNNGGALYSAYVAKCDFYRCYAENGFINYGCSISGCTFVDCIESYEAIQQMIDDPSTGSLIVLPKITYLFYGEGLVINRPVTIVGDGVTFDGQGKTRLITVTSENVILSGLTFQNTFLDSYEGSTIKCLEGSFKIQACTFINCLAQQGGWHGPDRPIIYSSTRNSRIVNTRFINCSSRSPLIVDGATIENCTFESAYDEYGKKYYYRLNNVFYSDAKVDYNEYSLKFSNSDIYNCELGNFSTTILNSNVYNCTFIGGSGPLENSTAYNSTFINNTGTSIYHGGAYGCTFINGYDFYEGTIYCGYFDGSTLVKESEVVNCTFEHCTAEDYGGAVYAGYVSEGNYYQLGRIYNCTFNNCCVYTHTGGAIYGGSVYNCRFINSTSGFLGGGAVAYARVYDSYFENCKSKKGGAAFQSEITNCTFKNCISDHGNLMYGGILFESNSVYDENDNNFYDVTFMRHIYLYAEDVNGSVNEDLPFTVNVRNYYGENINSGCIYFVSNGISYCCDVVDGVASFNLCYPKPYDSDIFINYISSNDYENKTITLTAHIEGKQVNNTFTDLQNLINSFEGDTITLENDYVFNETTDADLTGGILINKNGYFTIKGNNHYIDAKHAAKIFNIKKGYLTFENLYFLNAYGDKGDAIYTDGTLLYLKGCSFISCISHSDSAAIAGGRSIYVSASNCKFYDCRGGAINTEGSLNLPTIYNCRFIGCRSNNNGGAICGGSARDCTFISCYSLKKGGAIYGGNANSCKFMNCSATNGGAVADGNATSSTFTNCHASNNGGALLLTFANPIFENPIVPNGYANRCSFTDCSAKNEGGAVWNANVTQSDFINCHANTGGAIFYRVEDIEGVYSRGHVDNSIFINCHAKGNAGAAFITNVTNCYFFDCYAGSTGGAIYSDFIMEYDYTIHEYHTYSISYATNVSFFNCHANYAGAAHGYNVFNAQFFNCSANQIGAVYCIDITNAEFLNCSANSAAAVRGNAYNSIFMNCHSQEYGVLEYGSAHNCTFVNCSSLGDAGALYWSSGYDSLFINCSSGTNGGGIAWGAGINCTFINCDAYYQGGAIYYSMIDWGEAYSENIENSTFINCSSNFGGAVVDGTVINCYFENCSAISKGGAVAIASVFNSTFINCHCDDSGGALYKDSAYDSTFTNCTADIGGAISSGDAFNSTFIDCRSQRYGVIYDGSDINCTFINCEPKGILDFNITMSNKIIEGETLAINIRYDEVGRGKFIARINDVDYEGWNSWSYGEIEISDLPIGEYTVYVIYGGDRIFYPSNKSSAVTVKPTPRPIDIVMTYSNEVLEDGYNMIILNFTESLNDNITVEVQGKDYVVEVINGTALVNASGFYCDDWAEIGVWFEGNDDYLPVEKTDYFTVAANPHLKFRSKISDITVGSSITVRISIEPDAYNKIYVYLTKGNNTLVGSIYPDDDGNGNKRYKDLEVGEYTVLVSYPGDDYYGRSKINTTFKVLPVLCEPDLEVSAADITEGQDAIINVSINPNVEGDIILNVDGENYTITITDGEGSLTLSGLVRGEYEVTAFYAGDDTFESAVNTTSFKVTEAQTPEIDIPSMDNITGNDNIAVSLPTDAKGTVTLTVNGEDYVFDVMDGKANIKLPELANGDYPYTITYSGDGKYSPFSSSGTMKINKADVSENETTGNATVTPEIKIPSMDKPSEDGTVTVSLPKDATGTVTLTVDGKDYVFDVVDGKANIILPELGDGDHPYTITYSGDGKYSSFTSNGTLPKAAPKVNPKVTAKDLTMQYSAGNKYSVTVYGTNGKVAANTWVIFKVKGKQVAKAKTNAKGVATYKPTQVPGTYKISATALGKTVTKTLKVKQILTLKAVNVKKSAKKLVLTATLAKVNKKYLKGKKITFKFNGKKIKTVKTNKKGVAKVTITKALLKKLKVGKKVTYQATYLKNTVKKSVKVKK